MVFGKISENSAMKQLLSVSILLLIASCTKETFNHNVEDRLMDGKWYFDHVKFRKKGHLFSKDFSKGFEGSTIDFQEFGQLEAYDAQLGATAYGYWYIDSYNEGDETGKYDLTGNLSIPDLAISEDFLWKNVSVTNTSIRATAEKDGGTYTYSLRR